MQTRHQNKGQYFREQIYTTEKHVIPFIRKACTIDAGTSVLEIGCGEGGNLVPFLDAGCGVTGIDISPSKIENARNLLKDHPKYDRVKLVAKDIYLAENDLPDKFDLIVMRDVIEHIHDQDRFMGFVKRFLKPEGRFFLAFPPWHNPFGGHQQICSNRILSRLPYCHLLPGSIYKAMLKLGGEPAERIDSLIEIKETGISIERFERTLRKNNFSVLVKKLYLVNPHYDIKFKIKPREQNRFFGKLPFLTNLITTSAYYLIRHEE